MMATNLAVNVSNDEVIEPGATHGVDDEVHEVSSALVALTMDSITLSEEEVMAAMDDKAVAEAHTNEETDEKVQHVCRPDCSGCSETLRL